MNISINTIQANLTVINIDDKRVWMSYSTPVAFDSSTEPLTVSQNIWTVSTGKHLSVIDGGSKEAKARRLPADEFVAALRAMSYSS